MKKITNTSFVMGVGTIVTMIIGVLRVKTAAILIGVSGVGYLAQANVFVTLAITCCTLAMGAGINSYISKAKSENDKETYNAIIKKAFEIQTFSVIVFILISSIFIVPISKYLFNSDDFIFELFFIILLIPFITYSTGIMNPV